MDAVGSDLTFRPASGAADALAASQIIDTALSDLRVKRGRPPYEGPHDDAVPVLTHLMRADPETFWIASDGDDRPVGFGVGTTRPGLWFCSGLFLLPEYQGRGVGRRLFELALGGHPMRDEVAALTSSAANPISNKLYASHGIYPQLPLLSLEGSPAQVAGEAPRAGGDVPHVYTDEPAAGLGGRGAASKTGGLAVEPLTASAAHLADLAAIDAAVTGIDRTVDHRWHLEGVGHRGWLFRRRGRAAGYAYLGGDGAHGPGAIGPIATRHAKDQTPVLRYTLAEFAARRPGETASVMVPGPNLHAQRLLWQAGFRFEDAAGLLCASRPFGRFDRYVLAGDCVP